MLLVPDSSPRSKSNNYYHPIFDYLNWQIDTINYGSCIFYHFRIHVGSNTNNTMLICEVQKCIPSPNFRRP